MTSPRIPEQMLFTWAQAAVIANAKQRGLKAPTAEAVENAARLAMSQAGFRVIAESAWLAGRANAAPPSTRPLPKVKRGPDEQPLPGFDTVSLIGGAPSDGAV